MQTTAPAPHPPFAPASCTVAEWLSALATGTDPTPALQAARDQALATQALHLWIHVCPEAAWAAQLALLAQRLTETADRSALLRRYPLLGVPFAAKDNIDIAGEPTTAACPKFAHAAEGSATVVRKLLAAGAVWVGKTNLDQFATGLVGTRSPYGRPASVADASRISGGSSSGSAVAVARGIVAFSLGTDTAGSGRIPAGFNGLVGLKPTPGRVSTAGVLPACRTLDCVSIFAHTVDDAAHVLSVIEGTDATDVYSAFVPGPAHLPDTLRIGVPLAPQWDGDIGYGPAWQAALGHTSMLDHSLVEMDFAPLQQVAALLYEGPWVAERHSVVQALLRDDPEALDPTVRRVIERALGMTATQTFEAQYTLRALQAQLAGLWADVDVLMVPTAPHHPSFAEVDTDPVGANSLLGRYTNFVNLLGWCALAVPAGQAGMAGSNLPFGVTFIARGGMDAALAEAARRWLGVGAASPWLRTPAVEATLPIAVVGAHLSGLPLNGQLRERGATLLKATHTAPSYRLFALPGTTPPKPGLQRVARGGAAIEVEVWAMPMSAVGSFLALIPAPLGLGTLELADGSPVHGFLCEAQALEGARDITYFAGWRAYLASLASTPTA
jgi:allophanate hydrolase